MGDGTKIQWTEATWNPLRGCSRVSEGCRHCYAEQVAHRFSGPGMPYEGLTTPKGRWSGEVRFIPEKLEEPLRWKRPRMVFVNSMSDLFHEHVDDDFIAAVFAVMAGSPRHTFQVLTKRPERMRAWFGWIAEQGEILADAVGETPPPGGGAAAACALLADRFLGERFLDDHRGALSAAWPLPNVWLGVSVEDQRTADERIPLLLETPAAVRWVSYEPALGPVDFAPWLDPEGDCERCDAPCSSCPLHKAVFVDGEYDLSRPETCVTWPVTLDWIVAGGESGRHARPCSVGWLGEVVQQCETAGVACFVKQLGSQPVEHIPPSGAPDDGGDMRPLSLRDRKGGDPAEWPVELRVREFPEARA